MSVDWAEEFLEYWATPRDTYTRAFGVQMNDRTGHLSGQVQLSISANKLRRSKNLINTLLMACDLLSEMDEEDKADVLRAKLHLINEANKIKESMDGK